MLLSPVSRLIAFVSANNSIENQLQREQNQIEYAIK